MMGEVAKSLIVTVSTVDALAYLVENQVKSLLRMFLD